jgi:hypothetical protein
MLKANSKTLTVSYFLKGGQRSSSQEQQPKNSPSHEFLPQVILDSFIFLKRITPFTSELIIVIITFVPDEWLNFQAGGEYDMQTGGPPMNFTDGIEKLSKHECRV